MNIEEKMKKFLLEPLRNIREGTLLLSKNFRMPEDKVLWLKEREEYALTLSDKIPQKERMLRQIRHSLSVLSRDNPDDADDLRYRFYVINEFVIDAQTNEFFHKYSEAQSKKGSKGAAARWSGDVQQMLNDMVKELAKRDDDPSELWPLLWARLDEEQISAKDIEEPEKCYEHPQLPNGVYKYEAFKKQINRCRKNR